MRLEAASTERQRFGTLGVNGAHWHSAQTRHPHHCLWATCWYL